MNRPGRAGRAGHGYLRAIGLLAALVVALFTAGCGSGSGSDQGAAKDDRGDLTQLVYRFYDTMEARQFDKLTSVLAEGVVVTSPGMGTTTGRDKVIAQSAEAAKHEDRAQHVVTNVLVDVTGDSAKVSAFVDQLIGSSTTPKGKIAPEPSMTISSHMRYEATRTAEGWRISRIEGAVLWATQAPAAATGQ